MAIKEAMKKDMEKLDKNLRDICASSLPLLKELCDILPSRKALKAGGISDGILSGNEAISQLQVVMADVNEKIAVRLDSWTCRLPLTIPLQNLQELGYIGARITQLISFNLTPCGTQTPM